MKLFITMPKTETAKTFFTDQAMEKLREIGQVAQNPLERELAVDELVELATGADVLLTGWGTACMGKKDLERLPTVKLIAHTGGSVADLIEEDVYDLGISVLSGNNIFAKSVAEGCLCYTLSALRRMEYYEKLVRQGGWREDKFVNQGLIGKKVGIVGFGTISKFYLELLRWFDCHILIYSSHLDKEEAKKYGGRVAGLEEIFATCDIVSIHSSLTEKTRGMITRELLMKLKPDALFVNTARGAVIDEEALFELLMEGRFYAALDVFAKEPIDALHPIRKCPNVLLIPHMGGPTMDMRQVVVCELARDIERWAQGKPLRNQVPLDHRRRMTRNIR